VHINIIATLNKLAFDCREMSQEFIRMSEKNQLVCSVNGAAHRIIDLCAQKSEKRIRERAMLDLAG
jgi:hypothetical protein